MSNKFYQFKILIDKVDFEKYKEFGFQNPVLSDGYKMESSLIAEITNLEKENKIKYEVIIYRRTSDMDELIIRRPDELRNKHKINLQFVINILQAVRKQEFLEFKFERIKIRKVFDDETKRIPSKSKKTSKRKSISRKKK